MIETLEELWKVIPEFPNYQVSNLGYIYNILRDHMMARSYSVYGNMKISLRSEEDGSRYTRSVPQLVAEAFVDSPHPLCDAVLVLDGNYCNVAAYNLAWRPRWYVWKCVRQLKTYQPQHFKETPVINVVTGVQYESIVQAAIAEGLLFEEIWRSANTGIPLFPNDSIFAF